MGPTLRFAMRRTVLCLMLALTLIGCHSQQPVDSAPGSQRGANAGGSVGGGSIAPLTPNVGGTTPVAGGESIGDSGGSVGMSAKDMAHHVANKASSANA